MVIGNLKKPLDEAEESQGRVQDGGSARETGRPSVRWTSDLMTGNAVVTGFFADAVGQSMGTSAQIPRVRQVTSRGAAAGE